MISRSMYELTNRSKLHSGEKLKKLGKTCEYTCMMKERVKKVLALQHWLGLSACRIMLCKCVHTALALYICLLASFNVRQGRLAGLHFTRGAIFFLASAP